jgi:hypothetical protein
VKVGDFRAQTLRSEDPAALAEYLKDNKFVASKDVVEWVKFYTDKKWLLTAFKVNQQKSQSDYERFGFDPIMMKFKTDKPFFPYVVPSSNRRQATELDLYVVGSSPASNSVSDSKGLGRSWDSSIPKEKLESLEKALKLPAGELANLDHVSAFDKLPFAVEAKDDGFISFEPRWLGPVKSVFGTALGIAFIWGLSRLVLRRRK